MAPAAICFRLCAGGSGSFSLHTVRQPIITIAESNRLFTQIQVRYQNKNFQDDRFIGNSFRDGTNWLAGVTQYVYFADGAGHVRMGYTFDTDRTGGGSPSSAIPGVHSLTPIERIRPIVCRSE